MAARRGRTSEKQVKGRAGGTAAAAPLVLGDLLPGAFDLGLAVAAGAVVEATESFGASARARHGAPATGPRARPDDAVDADGEPQPRRHARMSLSVEPHPLRASTTG
jgi:hypothetical protein